MLRSRGAVDEAAGAYAEWMDDGGVGDAQRSMKILVNKQYEAHQFALVDVAQLRAWWESPVNDVMRDLHRCRAECADRHDPACQYVQDIDAQAAVDDAAAYISSLRGEGVIPLFVDSATVGARAPEGSAQARLTLSLILDPLVVNGEGRFGEGRHRLRTILGEGVTGDVPVIVG